MSLDPDMSNNINNNTSNLDPTSGGGYRIGMDNNGSLNVGDINHNSNINNSSHSLNGNSNNNNNNSSNSSSNSNNYNNGISINI